MKTRIIALTLLLIILAAPFAQVVYAEEGVDPEGEELPPEGEPETGDEPIDPDVFNLIQLRARLQWQETQQFFGDLEDLPPETQAQLQHAYQAMQSADEETENPRAAAEQYLRAMKEMRNAMRKQLREDPDAGDDLVEPTDEEPTGDDTTPPEDLDDQIAEAKQRLVQRFQERFQEHVAAMYSNVDDMAGDMSPDDAVKAQNALHHAEQKLLRIQERIHQGEYDEAVDELDETGEDLEDELDTVDDPATAQMLKTMNRLQARLQKMLERKERKAAEGMDTSDEDDELDQLQGNMNKNKNEYKENRGNNGTDSGNGNSSGNSVGDDQGNGNGNSGGSDNKGGSKGKGN